MYTKRTSGNFSSQGQVLFDSRHGFKVKSNLLTLAEGSCKYAQQQQARNLKKIRTRGILVRGERAALKLSNSLAYEVVEHQALNAELDAGEG